MHMCYKYTTPIYIYMYVRSFISHRFLQVRACEKKSMQISQTCVSHVHEPTFPAVWPFHQDTAVTTMAVATTRATTAMAMITMVAMATKVTFLDQGSWRWNLKFLVTRTIPKDKMLISSFWFLLFLLFCYCLLYIVSSSLSGTQEQMKNLAASTSHEQKHASLGSYKFLCICFYIRSACFFLRFNILHVVFECMCVCVIFHPPTLPSPFS